MHRKVLKLYTFIEHCIPFKMCTFILSKIILKNLNLQEWDNISLKKEIALSRGLSSNALMVNFETDRNNMLIQLIPLYLQNYWS